MIRAFQPDAAMDVVFNGPTRRGLGYGLGGDPAQGGSMEMGSTGGEFGHGVGGLTDRNGVELLAPTATTLSTSVVFACRNRSFRPS